MTGADFDKYADTWETIALKAINAETKKWRFGDHCYVQYDADEQKIFYDPTYVKKDPKSDWFEYLNSIIGTTDEMSIKKPDAAQHNNRWIRHRGVYFPTTVNWKTRDPNGPNFFRIRELEMGDERSGKVK